MASVDVHIWFYSDLTFAVRLMPLGSAVRSLLHTFLPSFLPLDVDYSFKLIYLCWRQLFTGSNGCNKGRKRSAESFLYKPL